jgi:hypothetical protein
VVTEDVFEENFDAAGTITVNNPNPEDALVVPLTDLLNGHSGVIDQTSCDFDGTNLTVAAGGSETCDYEANDLPYDDVADAPTLNTATITLNSIVFSASDPIEWTVNVIRGSATLNDDRYPYSGEPVSDGWTSTYPDSYTCSTNLGDYIGGMDLDNQVSNTAEVYSESALQDSSTATTEIDCYIPLVSKTANTSFDRTWTWTIDKWADQTEITLLNGVTVTVNYTIVLDATSADSNWGIDGTITVQNPNPDSAMIVALSDVLDDGTTVVIDEATCEYSSGYLMVAASSSETCEYSANPDDDSATENTATVTLNGIDFDATAVVDWSSATINHIDEEITVTDDYGTPGDTTDDLTWTINALTDTLPFTIEYSRMFTVADFPFCGDHYVINTASFLTNELFLSDVDSWSGLFHIPCDEGCTPGFWQGGTGFPLWDEEPDGDFIPPNGNPFAHDTLFNDFFTSHDDLAGLTMFELVSTGGGPNPVRKAARDLVAAFLNASHSGVNYPYTTAQLTAMWDTAVADGGDQAFIDLHGDLNEANELGCQIG